MSDLSPERLSEISQQLRDASTWVSGPRAAKLNSLADELAGEPTEESNESDQGSVRNDLEDNPIGDIYPDRDL